MALTFRCWDPTGPILRDDVNTSLDAPIVTALNTSQETERLGVRMTLGSGEYEYDTEEWTTPTGAQERIRQILFARDDVASCEVVTLWRRKDG